jgi:hypothetical protein
MKNDKLIFSDYSVFFSLCSIFLIFIFPNFSILFQKTKSTRFGKRMVRTLLPTVRLEEEACCIDRHAPRLPSRAGLYIPPSPHLPLPASIHRFSLC